jgi:hypothetical protein
VQALYAQCRNTDGAEVEDQGLVMVMVERDSPWIVSSICHLTNTSPQTRRLTDPAPWQAVVASVTVTGVWDVQQ